MNPLDDANPEMLSEVVNGRVPADVEALCDRVDTHGLQQGDNFKGEGNVVAVVAIGATPVW